MKNIGMKPILKTLIWVTAFLTISYFIGDMTRQNMDWYETLVKSAYNPPRLAFPIAWTTLYIMLAIAGSVFWSKKEQESGRKHLFLFSAYMIMNWAWSFIFFSFHMITIGFIWIMLSDLLLLFLIISAWKNNQKPEAYLLIPTLLWGIFAAYLNGYISFAN